VVSIHNYICIYSHLVRVYKDPSWFSHRYQDYRGAHWLLGFFMTGHNDFTTSCCLFSLPWVVFQLDIEEGRCI
jgi:hypothetical protein